MDRDFVPKERIEFVDVPGSLSPPPDVDDIRPDSSQPAEIEIPIGTKEYPYFTIDLDDLGEDGTPLKIAELRIPGNVKTVNLYFKEDSDATEWTYSALKVDVKEDGYVEIPSDWPRDENGTVAIGILKIELVEPRSERDELYLLRIDIIGCAPCISCKN